jgi:hypothetical protein
MKQFSDSVPPKLGAGDKTMPLSEEVHRRLSARAATDLDVASMLSLFTKPDEAASEPPLNQVSEDSETPKV